MESDLSLEKEDFYLSSKGYKVFTEKKLKGGGIIFEVIVGAVPMDSIPKQVSNFGTVFEPL